MPVCPAFGLTVRPSLCSSGTIAKLGSKRHHDLLLKDIDSLDKIGCFALTELSCTFQEPGCVADFAVSGCAADGNNAVEMETTAVWDQSAQEFVINSPTTGSCAVSGFPCSFSRVCSRV